MWLKQNKKHLSCVQEVLETGVESMVENRFILSINFPIASCLISFIYNNIKFFFFINKPII